MRHLHQQRQGGRSHGLPTSCLHASPSSGVLQDLSDRPRDFRPCFEIYSGIAPLDIPLLTSGHNSSGSQCFWLGSASSDCFLDFTDYSPTAKLLLRVLFEFETHWDCNIQWVDQQFQPLPHVSPYQAFLCERGLLHAQWRLFPRTHWVLQHWLLINADVLFEVMGVLNVESVRKSDLTRSNRSSIAPS